MGTREEKGVAMGGRRRLALIDFPEPLTPLFYGQF